jgi:hypothetical protein
VSRSSAAALVVALTTLSPAAALAATTAKKPTPPALPKQTRVDGARLAARTNAAIRRRTVARRERAQAPSNDPRLAAIRMCESHGNYATNTGNGFYGAYQFDIGTWRSVGGSGLPSSAPPAEQDRRATMLLQRSGSSPWPVCG